MGCCICTDAEGGVARTRGWLVREPGVHARGNRAIRNERLCYAYGVGHGHGDA